MFIVHNCRSILSPVVDWKGLGIDPPAESTRASSTGQVKASTTYEEWFSGQSDGVQNDIIGPARAKLFRAGKITFRDMVGKDNRVLSVAELVS